jgi:hypothetical protein
MGASRYEELKKNSLVGWFDGSSWAVRRSIRFDLLVDQAIDSTQLGYGSIPFEQFGCRIQN